MRINWDDTYGSAYITHSPKSISLLANYDERKIFNRTTTTTSSNSNTKKIERSTQNLPFSLFIHEYAILSHVSSVSRRLSVFEYIFIHSAIQAFIVSPQHRATASYKTTTICSIRFNACWKHTMILSLSISLRFFSHLPRFFFSFTFSTAAAIVAHFHGPKNKREYREEYRVVGG